MYGGWLVEWKGRLREKMRPHYSEATSTQKAQTKCLNIVDYDTFTSNTFHAVSKPLSSEVPFFKLNEV